MLEKLQIIKFESFKNKCHSIFHDFSHFGIVSGLLLEYVGFAWDPVRVSYDGLMLLPEGPRTFRESLGGPGTL